MNQNMFKAFVDQSVDGVLVIDSDGIVRFANPAAIAMFASTASELIGSHLGVPATNQPTELVVPVGQQPRHVEMRASEVQWEGETASLASLRDITEQKRAAAELRQFEWLLEKETQPRHHLPEAVYGDVTALNTERTILDGAGKETLASLARDVMDLMDTSVAVYERNGDYAFGLFVSGWCRTMDAASWALCGTHDKRQALQCGKWLCHESCWGVSTDAMTSGTPTDVACTGGIRLYAVPIRASGEVIGSISMGYGVPPTTDESLRELATAYDTDIAVLREAALAYKPRPPFIIEVAKSRLRSVARTIGEIIDRNRAEVALRKSRDALEEAQSVAAVGSWEHDAATGRPTWSKEMYRLFGQDPLDGEPDWEQHREFIHPEDWDRLDQAVQAAITEGRSYSEEFRIDGLDDGELRWVHSIGRAIKDKDGNVIRLMGTVQDVTERKRTEGERATLELKLHQAQKLESIGRLAGGVAHDFNNLLMGVMNYVELCRDEVAPDHPIREWLDEITADAQRSANLTRQLLAFARKQTITPVVIDLNEAVASMLKLLRRLIGEDVDLNWKPGLNLSSVKLDPSQVDQILANLCVNARDAIGGVGEVTIETRNATLDAEYCTMHADAVPGNYVLLMVSDTGCGMSGETLEHIFEPFFTTKDVGRGTGLGLATVYGIVKQNEGHISVYSAPGKGTTFRIYLPRFTDQAEEILEDEAPEAVVGGKETILLVEDEKSIRVTMRRFLGDLGYNVLTADCPAEALRLAKEHAGAIHLLITDVIMPGMSGRDLAIHLATDRPEMRRLFMSGFTADVIAHRGILDEGVEFLAKPIARDELTRKVRELMDREG